jgi:hypothetical protein
VDLVENEDLDANVAKRVDGAPLYIDDAGARAMWRVNGGEDLREERAVQRLNLALFVDRKNDGVCGWIAIETTSRNLSTKRGSLGSLNWRVRCGCRP